MSYLNWTTVIAYRPFLDPIDLHDQWLWLLIPLVMSIALVYKTIKLHALEDLVKETARLSLTILGFIAIAGVLCWGLAEVM